MNDILIRVGLGAIAGLTYFAGAIPNNMQLADISNLPLQIWLYAAINIITGVVSPSIVRKLPGIKQGA